ncbi:MAG: hypothetical protein ACLTBF_11405 [Christensenellales bacterium]
MNELLEVYQAAYDRYAAANKSAPFLWHILFLTEGNAPFQLTSIKIDQNSLEAML